MLTWWLSTFKLMTKYHNQHFQVDKKLKKKFFYSLIIVIHRHHPEKHWNGFLLSLKTVVHLGSFFLLLYQLCLVYPKDVSLELYSSSFTSVHFQPKQTSRVLPSTSSLVIPKQESVLSIPLVALNSRLPSTPSSPGQGMQTPGTSVVESSSIHLRTESSLPAQSGGYLSNLNHLSQSSA